MAIQIETLIGPAFAASYLVNGDDSGLDERERAALDQWAEREGVQAFHGTTDSEPWFTWAGRVHYREGDSEGLTVCEYLVSLRA